MSSELATEQLGGCSIATSNIHAYLLHNTQCPYTALGAYACRHEEAAQLRQQSYLTISYIKGLALIETEHTKQAMGCNRDWYACKFRVDTEQ